MLFLEEHDPHIVFWFFILTWLTIKLCLLAKYATLGRAISLNLFLYHFLIDNDRESGSIELAINSSPVKKSSFDAFCSTLIGKRLPKYRSLL